MCIVFIALPSNSQNKWSHWSCGNLNPTLVRAECEFTLGDDTGYSGNRQLLIDRINGNGGNVYVRVYDAENGEKLLEENPGVGGRETFYFDREKRKRGYKIFMRLHNPGSSVDFRVGRTVY